MNRSKILASGAIAAAVGAVLYFGVLKSEVPPGDTFGTIAPAQRYQALIGGYSQCDGGESGPCVCDADNRCQGQAGGQVINTIPAFFDYPSTLSVDLVFDSCAFGCPGGENDGTAPAP